jgi:hypothetical protein
MKPYCGEIYVSPRSIGYVVNMGLTPGYIADAILGVFLRR